MDNLCIFCKIANEKKSEKRIYENDNFFSLLDIKPAVEGHSLIVSKRHFKNILDMPESLGGELLDCIKKTSFEMMKRTKSEGFNIVVNSLNVAGQKVDHFHLHILPRKKGDGIKMIA